jgi:hypothetical protein
MHPSDIIPVSTLRTSTNTIFKDLQHPKCIIVNNKPQAMLISIKDYDRLAEYFEDRQTVVDFGKKGIDPKKLLAAHKKK